MGSGERRMASRAGEGNGTAGSRLPYLRDIVAVVGIVPDTLGYVVFR